ncbi:GNAT family N-acetyltransferase [uncultured Clostridium sp.]|uniref:GNAT family N-acetyltransferase n=1 Tax=uncultured Clostridium sp. TaxID=59620 RepID=UPI0025DABEFB|nr:GNAT family N-acetyltransferase [uncultured Clostridium sp.]
MIINYDSTKNQQILDNILLEELKVKTGRDSREEKIISLASIIDGNYAGGILGEITFETCYIKYLGTKNEYRGRGIGSELIYSLEEELIKLGVKKVYLTTQDYQAKNFYLKMKYEIISEIKNVPFGGTTRYIFIKNLSE